MTSSFCAGRGHSLGRTERKAAERLEARQEGDVGVVALTELKAGERGEIAYLSATEAGKMQKLMSMGVLPGSDLEVTRTFPTYIFKVGHSEFAVDDDLAREIFVRKV